MEKKIKVPHLEIKNTNKMNIHYNLQQESENSTQDQGVPRNLPPIRNF